ncbi:PREDICTED: GDSL esterase/lipase 1-like [Lupinus angustifolius]|uniref:GDSL esterase/lipase 1-like n=1 Tax=Lupinus angustifolius TaxID=3871 RepID=UPI00092F3DAA|nr:PREDICTED: GDSL esterase/lipase 1-like [Lupinus angustifolius]
MHKFRMKSSRIKICFLILYTKLYIATLCHGFCLAEEHVALFIFGDSVFDVGNNNYINTTTDMQANFLPYGETFFKYPTGRPSDGRLIPDFIVEYANMPFIPPHLQPGNHQYTDGANFASAGAGALAETNQGLVIDLKTQLKYFIEIERLVKQKLGDAEGGRLVSKATYLFSIGSNDYLVPFISNSTMLQKHPIKEYVNMVIGNLTTVIQEIYEKGGRQFGFLNVPPLGCLPVLKALMPADKDGCVEGAMELAQLHNGALRKVLQKLNTQLKGFKYSYMDFYTSYNERMNSPSKYGFKEGNIGCCGGGPYRGFQSCGGKRSVKEYELCENVEEYVIFDAVHPTEKTYQQIAELMWNGDHNVAGPYNLRELYEG